MFTGTVTAIDATSFFNATDSKMTLITPAYLSQQQQLHAQRPDYGTSSHKYIEHVATLCKQTGTRDVLDYGCGKSMLQKGLPFPIQNYDPALEEFTRRPIPADIVVCTDVLEHIEPDCLKAVMDDLAGLTRKLLFVNVACRPASKTLPDGRNAHLLVETPNWWLTWFLPRFDLQSFQATSGDFTALFMPKQGATNANA